MTSRPGPFDRADFPFALRLVTEAAALAAWKWVGRSQKEAGDGAAVDAMRRSEEHTSELQSLMRISYAVFRLKKKNSSNRSYLKLRDTERLSLTHTEKGFLN